MPFDLDTDQTTVHRNKIMTFILAFDFQLGSLVLLSFLCTPVKQLFLIKERLRNTSVLEVRSVWPTVKQSFQFWSGDDDTTEFDFVLYCGKATTTDKVAPLS